MIEKILYNSKDEDLVGLTDIVPATVVLKIGKKGAKIAKVFINANAAFTYLCTDDPEKRELILRCLNVKNANYFSTPASGFEEPEDPEVRIRLKRRVLRAKFVTGHPYFTKLLLDTGNAELVENRYWEKTSSFWGIAKDGTGENNHGKILMELREEARDLIRGKKTPKVTKETSSKNATKAKSPIRTKAEKFTNKAKVKAKAEKFTNKTVKSGGTK